MGWVLCISEWVYFCCRGACSLGSSILKTTHIGGLLSLLMVGHVMSCDCHVISTGYHMVPEGARDPDGLVSDTPSLLVGAHVVSLV